MPRRLQGTLLTCPIGYCSAIVQGTDLSALPYLLHLFPGPHRAGVPGRLVPVGSNCASRRRDVSRGSVHPRLETQVRVESGVGQAFWSERRARVGSERRSSLTRPSGRRLDRPSGLSFRYLGRPRSCMSFATSSAGPSFCWEAGP